jgi:L-iditol 2-dehydrogenase
MNVMRLYGVGELRISNEPIPVPLPGEQLVRVTTVGICGSDLHWFIQSGIGDARLTRPLVLGHEFSGLTESGERVAVDPAIPCGKCEYCKQGNQNLCPEVRFAGHGSEDGALREYLAWDNQHCFQLPDLLTDEEGAMLEPLGVAIHAVDLAQIKPGMTVGVFGCGPIGLLIVQMARLAGATNVIATDIFPHRVQAARAFGANHTYQVDNRLPDELVREASGGRGVDVAFDAAGTQNAVDDAFAAVIPGGKVILVGIPDDDKTSFSASTARRKGLTIKMVRRMKFTYPRAIDLVVHQRVNVLSLITHRFPLAQAQEAFMTASRRDGLKVMVQL